MTSQVCCLLVGYYKQCGGLIALFEDASTGVAAQAMVYGVPAVEGTYYLGVFDDTTTTCPYNLTARLERTLAYGHQVLMSCLTLIVDQFLITSK